MDNFKKYLQAKIAEYAERYKELQMLKIQHIDDDGLLATYSAQASTVWDLNCEVERILLEYEAMRIHKLYELLIDSNNQLIHIMRNHDNLENINEILRIINESKSCLISATSQEYLNS